MRGWKCEACGMLFHSASVFDAHRVGAYEKGHMTGKGKRTRYVVDSPNTRRCLSEKELEAKGYTRNERGEWQSAKPFTERVA